MWWDQSSTEWNLCYRVPVQRIWRRPFPGPPDRIDHVENLSHLLLNMEHPSREAVAWCFYHAGLYMDYGPYIIVEYCQPTVRVQIPKSIADRGWISKREDIQRLLYRMGVLNHSNVDEFFFQNPEWALKSWDTDQDIKYRTLVLTQRRLASGLG